MTIVLMRMSVAVILSLNAGKRTSPKGFYVLIVKNTRISIGIPTKSRKPISNIIIIFVIAKV